MSDLRKAAQQALEALIWHDETVRTRADSAAITALRAALAQPEQLVVDGDDLPTLTKWTPMSEYAAKSAAVPGRAEALKQAGYTRRPRQLPKEDEPVAYQWLGTSVIRKRVPKTAEADAWKPLYAHPPQRKPLTEKFIKIIIAAEMCGSGNVASLVDIGRAIERAHGII